MRWVPAAVTHPSRCAVVPFIGRDHPDGFIDTGSEMQNGGDGRWDFHVYVSVVAVKEMAGLIGYVDPAALTEQIAALEAQLSLAEAERDEANRIVDAIDVMESKDFTRRKKPGRKPVEREVV